MARRQLAEQAIERPARRRVRARSGRAAARAAARARRSARCRSTTCCVRLHDLVRRPARASRTSSIAFPTARSAARTSTATGSSRSRRAASRRRHRRARTTAFDGGMLARRAPRRTTTIRARAPHLPARGRRRSARVDADRTRSSRSHETGITCTEPVYDATARSSRCSPSTSTSARCRRSSRGPRSIRRAHGRVHARRDDPRVSRGRRCRDRDGERTGCSATTTSRIRRSTRCSRDRHDAADRAARSSSSTRRDGDYLASVAPIGGKRAGRRRRRSTGTSRRSCPSARCSAPTHRLERRACSRRRGALAIARRRRADARVEPRAHAARRSRPRASEARSAEARARELGSYRLVARLGAGGMGEVWRAEHRLLARAGRDQADPPRGAARSEHARRDPRAVPARGADARVDAVAPHDRALRLRRHRRRRRSST